MRSGAPAAPAGLCHAARNRRVFAHAGAGGGEKDAIVHCRLSGARPVHRVLAVPAREVVEASGMRHSEPDRKRTLSRVASLSDAGCPNPIVAAPPVIPAGAPEVVPRHAWRFPALADAAPARRRGFRRGAWGSYFTGTSISGTDPAQVAAPRRNPASGRWSGPQAAAPSRCTGESASGQGIAPGFTEQSPRAGDAVPSHFFGNRPHPSSAPSC